MIREILTKSPLLVMPMGALFLFMVVFLTVIVVVMRRGKHGYDAVARLALDDADRPENRSIR